MSVQKTFAIVVTHDQGSATAHVNIVRNDKRFCLRSINHTQAGTDYLPCAQRYAAALEEFLQ